MIAKFDDFLKTLTPEVIEKIADSANLKTQQIRESSSDVTCFGNQVGMISFTFSLELLGLYHKWLEQQI